jgi:hypothetical protein
MHGKLQFQVLLTALQTLPINARQLSKRELADSNFVSLKLQYTHVKD